MKKNFPVKILVSMGLLFVVGILIFIHVRAGNTNLITSNGFMPVSTGLSMLCIAVIVVMFFPKDIKSYPAGKKFLIGAVASLIMIVVTMGFVILAAFLFG